MGARRMGVVVRFAVLPAERVFNLCSPRYLPEITKHWPGKRPWWDAHYNAVRDLMERMYVDKFNGASRHYERLQQSVAAQGFRNPIMVSAGGLQHRRQSELPPGLWGRDDNIVCEYLGGSRLWVAQRLGLDIPCIVNDANGVVPDGEVLDSCADIACKFVDLPARVRLDERGAYVNDLPYTHLPESERYGLAQQSKIRRSIIYSIAHAVRAWLEANDG